MFKYFSRLVNLMVIILLKLKKVCTLTPEKNIVSKDSRVLVTLQPKRVFPGGGYIIITMPTGWSTYPPPSPMDGIVYNSNDFNC